MSQTLVHLVRHGEVHNPKGLLYGRLPGYRLSLAGEAMAVADAEFLAAQPTDVARIVASPLLRTQQTAAPIAAHFCLPVALDPRLIEAGSHLEGLRVTPRTFLSPARWGLVRNPLRPSWGESYEHIAERMCEAIFEAVAHGPGTRIVIVTHQLPIWIARSALTGARLWHDPRKRECDLASITTLHFEADRLVGVDYDDPAAGIERTRYEA